MVQPELQWDGAPWWALLAKLGLMLMLYCLSPCSAPEFSEADDVMGRQKLCLVWRADREPGL